MSAADGTISGMPDSLSERVQQILALDTSRPGKKALGTLLSLLDLTTLEGSDNSAKIAALCRKALSFGEEGMPLPAAVCVYPVFVGEAKALLKGSPVRVASVAGAFPSGQSPLNLRVEEVRFAIDQGADEIDMVISRGKLLEGNDSFVFDEVAAIREVCGSAHLKVILETGELAIPDLIRKAGEIAIRAGADFIKTSTGKMIPAATHVAVFIMCGVVRDHYNRSGKRIGIKPAGGISDTATAWSYYSILRHELGEEWLQPALFRIGASRLADNLRTDFLKL